MMGFDFSGRHILVTGASSGIGRQIAIDCLNNKASVTGLGRREEELLATGTASQHPDAFDIAQVDLLDDAALEAFIDRVPILNGLVANAGAASYLPAKFLTAEKLSSVFKINFEANVTLIAMLLKKRKLANGASVVLMSSISSYLGVVGTAHYAASKAALSAYGRVLASELAPQKIRVNSIAPGIVITELIDAQSTLTDEIKKKTAASYPLGLGTPRDVSGPTQFLLSDMSRWITGQTLILDGGHLLT